MLHVQKPSDVRSPQHLRFSVIVCAYTEARWDEMLAAVASLQAQNYPPHEILMVIDHNLALFQRAQRYLAKAGVTILENDGSRGLSSARNKGLTAATGDVIAFMDEDAKAAPNWLAQLAKIYVQPDVMGVGGSILPNWLSGRPNWFPEEFDWVVGCTYRGMPKVETPVRNLIGCNMSFRRFVGELNGGFRDGIGRIGKIPLGCEETEYCIRASQRWPEKTWIYNPQAQVFHNVPASRATWSYFRSRCYAEGLSKALIGQFVGTTSSLASESAYVRTTIPQAVIRNLALTLLHFDFNGLRRATALIAGLGLTIYGYLFARTSLATKNVLTHLPVRKAFYSEKI